MRYTLRLIALAVFIGVGTMLPGCESETASTPSMYDRQQQAMKRGEYSPFTETPDISGGGIGNFDRKAAGKDANDFFNP